MAAPSVSQRGVAPLFIILVVLILVAVALGAFVMTGVVSVPGLSKKTTEEASTVSLKEEYQNPFDEKTQYKNPFDSYQNPFDTLQ